MNSKKQIALLYLIKILILLVLDVLTISFLLFPLGKIKGELFFPVLADILTALFFVNLLCLAYRAIRRSIYKRMAGILAAVTGFYYLFVTIFTYWSIPWISAKWYGFSALIAFVFYLFCCLSLYRSESGSRLRVKKRVQADSMQMLMMQLQNCFYELRPLLEKRQYVSLSRALGELREWLEFSVPFGRSRQPVVEDMEDQVFHKTRLLLEQMQRLPHARNQSEAVSRLVSDIFSVTELLKSRERLRVG